MVPGEEPVLSLLNPASVDEYLRSRRAMLQTGEDGVQEQTSTFTSGFSVAPQVDIAANPGGGSTAVAQSTSGSDVPTWVYPVLFSLIAVSVCICSVVLFAVWVCKTKKPSAGDKLADEVNGAAGDDSAVNIYLSPMPNAQA